MLQALCIGVAAKSLLMPLLLWLVLPLISPPQFSSQPPAPPPNPPTSPSTTSHKTSPPTRLPPPRTTQPPPQQPRTIPPPPGRTALEAPRQRLAPKPSRNRPNFRRILESQTAAQRRRQPHHLHRPARRLLSRTKVGP